MKRFVFFSVAIGLLSSPLFAGTMSSEDDTEPCWGPTEACSNAAPRAVGYTTHRFVSFSIAPAWSNNGQTQTLTLQPDIQKKYVASYRSNVFPYGEIFLGLQKQMTKELFIQLGIEGGAGGSARFRGDIWEDADPNFINYTYSYNVNEGRILAKMKLLADIHFYDTRPFGSVGLGIGFNHAYHFNTQATIPEEVPAPSFNSKLTTTFAYTLGAGLEEALNDHWHAAISYEFANWGSSELAAANGQTIGQGLTVNNIYINSVFLTLTYFT